MLVMGLQQPPQIVHSQSSLLQDGRQRLWLQDLARVLRYGDQARLGGVRELNMAAALSINFPSIPTQSAQQLRRGDPGLTWAHAA
jgi:hypothetical protein